MAKADSTPILQIFSVVTAMDKERRSLLLKDALVHVISEYGTRSFTSWRDLIGKDPIVLPHPNDAEAEIEISPVWDGKSRETIRVLISILHTTRFGITMPTTSFLIDAENRRR